MNEKYDENKPLYGSKGIDTFLKLIVQKYPHVNVGQLLKYAEMEPYQVQDEGHLFSQRQINRFYNKLVELTGNRNIAREAGRFSSSPVAFHNIARFAIGFLSPVKFYQLIEKNVNKISKASRYEANILGPNKVEIIVTPNPGTREEPFQCENRMGYWEAVSILFKLKPPTIEHTECLFRGGKSCRYFVSWPKSPITLLKTIRNMGLALLALMCVLFPVANKLTGLPRLSAMTVVTVYALFATIILIFNWYIKKLETANLEETIDVLRNSTDELNEQIDINYANSLLINEVSQILANQSETKGLFAELIEVLHKRLDFDRILIMLADTDNTRLRFQAGFGYDKEQETVLDDLTFHLDKPESRGIFYRSYHDKKPILINDIDTIKEDLSERSYTFAKKMNAKSLICCPIIHDEEAMGVLAVDNIKSKKPLLQRDLNLLMGIALQLGSRLHNIKLESHLRQIQKMEAVGNLAGGVAHDFNNILTTILGYSQMMTMKLTPEDQLWKMADSIHHAGLKASSLTQQLLAFSRKQVLEMKVTNLNIIVEDMTKMLARLIGEDIVLKTFLSAHVGSIMADTSQIGQILMNLVVNARDAMPNGGNLTLETGDIYIEEKYAFNRKDIKPGHFSMLSITDTGKGMSTELREKIFEPFFTTKGPGKGTGLGLSTVYGIVKQHNGYIHVYSELNHGTCFKIYFPIIDQEIDEVTFKRNLTMPGGDETILIVDDDESIRSMIADTLQPLGYNVLKASSGDEALDLSRASDQQIDLILSDVIMPGMNGRQLVDAIQKEQPGIRCILMSGYTDNVIAQHGALQAEYTLINKPLLPVALANRIREVLDGEPRSTKTAKSVSD